MSEALFNSLMRKRKKAKKRKKQRELNKVPLKILRREKYNNLSLLTLKPKEKKRKNDYTHLIRSPSAIGHSAYRTKAGLNEFLKTTGLKVSNEKHGSRSLKLKGSYQRISYQGTQAKLDKKAKKEKWKPTKVMSNGQFVRGYIQKTTRGNRIHYMNPNYKPRKLKYVWK
ncbi:MAG: hypothetical protein ACTSRU_01820 [Candidatus Hodarchaeales archaeon]